MSETAQDKMTVLKARARALARELDREAPREGRLEVVEFSLAGETYAVEHRQVKEVYPLRDLAPLPCTPPFVLGIINFRGQILTVIDFRGLLGLSVPQESRAGQIVVIEAGETQLGLLVDEIKGVRCVPAEDLQSGLVTLTGVSAEYVRGVTHDGTAVLDAVAILSSDGFVVHDPETALRC